MKRTILYPVYNTIPGARCIDFGGWELPVQFESGISGEHLAVRHTAGIFDISHMGEILVTGPGAFEFLNTLLPAKLKGKAPGRCVYTPMCTPEGGVVDDLLIYIFSETEYLLVVNAANIEKDFDWITAGNSLITEYKGVVNIENLSSLFVQIAVQGPLSAEILLTSLTETDNSFDSGQVESLRYYRFLRGEISGIPAIISRTGYTGEDGYEIYLHTDGSNLHRETAAALWSVLEKHVRESGGLPCGLGARDTLRLEACLPLYGHELGMEISPVEAGLSMFLDFGKEFIGKEALEGQTREGSPRTLKGIKMLDKGVPREGCAVYKDGKLIGAVTSGTKSPVLDEFIGLVLIHSGSAEPGDNIEIEIHNKRKKAEIVSTPFYSRRK